MTCQCHPIALASTQSPRETPELLLVLRVGLTALALYNRPRYTAAGLLVGTVGLIEGEKKGHDYIEQLGGSGFNSIAKLLIPTAFVISHLDKRLCCSNVEAILMGAIFGNYMRQLWN